MLKQYHYDQDKNLTGLFVQSGNAILANNRYLYDGNGNRTRKQQLGGETLYHYDPLNQLQKVQYPGYTEELFYDKAGNRTKRIAQGVEELYQYDPRNRLTAYTKNGATTLFRYDHAGNLLADDKARYSYDAFNRTTQVKTFDGNIQINRYDAEDLRHEMEENGSLVRFIFNPDREAVVESDAHNLIRYIRSSELIARNTDAARTYYHYVSDEMGSTTHIVDEDGIVFNHYTYDAWGNLTAQEEAVPNRFKFTGQQLDPVTQQYYLRARFYNPVIARFTQEDTYRGDGLNLYAYCQNNPVFYTDPSGNVCPEGTKDPLLHAPVPSPNQQQSTALVPYDPHFASEQRMRNHEIYYDANTKRWRDVGNGQFVSTPTSQMNPGNQPHCPTPDLPNSEGIVHGINNPIVKQSVEIGQEAHRQLEREGEGIWEPEQTIHLNDGTTVRKDGISLADPKTVRIIKPDTPSGRRAAEARAKIMRDNGFIPVIDYYDPKDPRFLPGSPTYIGPMSKR